MKLSKTITHVQVAKDCELELHILYKSASNYDIDEVYCDGKLIPMSLFKVMAEESAIDFDDEAGRAVAKEIFEIMNNRS